jgi:hypothetical protein
VRSVRNPGLVAPAAVVFLLSLGPSPVWPASPREATATAESRALFADVTDAAGIDFVHAHGGTGRKYLPETMGSGGCALDYDSDGFVDVYLVQAGALPGAGYRGPTAVNRLYRNRGNGTFQDVTDHAGVGDAGYGMGAVATDYDGDGDRDIYVVNYGPNALLRNNGDGTFTNVARRAGVDDDRWGSSAAFFDADGDADLDLYVANYVDFSVATHVECGNPSQGRVAYCSPDAYPLAPDVFYRNRGDGTFEDATAEAGLTDGSGKGLGVVVADVDNDGDPDIYVANDSTPNFLYENLGQGHFEEIGLFAGVGYNGKGLTEAGMGADIGDVNGDGFLDIFVTNLSRETNSLYLGGPEAFRYATPESGLHTRSYASLGFGTDLLDLDGDGDLDIFVANGHVIDDIEVVDDSITWRQPSQVFLNDGQGHFAELDAEMVGPLSIPRVARGSITLDYDNDGRLDLLVSFNNDRARLFRNVHGPAGHWIGFSLEAETPNPEAVGARVIVETEDGTQIEEVKSGSSYETGSDPRLYFGLGPAPRVSRVTVRWPGGATQQFEGLSAGRYYRLRQGTEPVPLD